MILIITKILNLGIPPKIGPQCPPPSSSGLSSHIQCFITVPLSIYINIFYEQNVAELAYFKLFSNFWKTAYTANMSEKQFFLISVSALSAFLKTPIGLSIDKGQYGKEESNIFAS